MGLLWLALLVAALWSAVNSWSYTNTLNAAIRSGDYYAGAVGLQAVIDADPLLAMYPQQQGMLYAFDALTDPARSTTPAIEAFRRAADLAPEYTANWANLGALYASISEYQSAALALRRAMQLAPDDPFFGYTAARYAELSGDFESARTWYTEAVTRYPDLVMLPDWDESAIRREIALSAPPLSDLGQVIRLIEAGDPPAARAIWTGSVWNGTSSRDAVIDYLISQAAGQDEAMRWLIIAQNAAVTPLDQAWVHYGRFAAYGDSAELDAARDAAYLTALQADLTGVDWANGANISYGQYLRMALPRQFVPQLGWTPAEPALLYLLGDS